MTKPVVQFVAYVSDIAGFKPGYLYLRINGTHYRIYREQYQPLQCVVLPNRRAVKEDIRGFTASVSGLFAVHQLDHAPFTPETLDTIAEAAVEQLRIAV